jgi:hypothetical protein
MGSFLAIRQPDRRKISVAVLVSAFLVTLGSAPVSAEGSYAPGDSPAAASGIIDLTPLMELPPAERAVQLQGVGSWFIDESGALSLRDVMNRDFDETPMLDFGIIDAAVWSRFRLESEEDSSWILFCRSHKVDRFDFHAVYPDGRIETSSAGTEIPLSDRYSPEPRNSPHGRRTRGYLRAGSDKKLPLQGFHRFERFIFPQLYPS